MDETNIDNELTEQLEYLIDNNLFFENMPIHTCNIHMEQFIKYKTKNKFILKDLVENTINRYLDNIKEEKRLYELEDDANLLFSKQRYKNYIPKNIIEKLKSNFIKSNLYYLETVVSSVTYPFLEYFYLFLNSINHSLYIKKNHFDKTSEYTHKNYKEKIDKKKEKAEDTFNEEELRSVKLHEGLIDTYEENEIEGSVLISILTSKLVDMEKLDKKDSKTLENNRHFNKLFEKVNFTKKEMHNGFAQACYWNFAQANYNSYKSFLTNYNRNKTNTIPLVGKSIIVNKIIELFNIALDKEEILQIRQNKKAPKVLKEYDGIVIYTTKDLSKLEKDFNKFMVKNFFSQTEKIRKFTEENEELVFQITTQLRYQFY